LNEVFAVRVLAVLRELEIPEFMTNVNGGAIALENPLGCLQRFSYPLTRSALSLL
jgi:acetyl-CoA acetyltransferase